MAQTQLTNNKNKLLIKESPHHLVDNLIAKHHYSNKVTSNRWKSFAVFWKGKLSGAMQIGYGIRPEKKRHIIEGANSETVKEFDRMWLSDDMPKNSESKCIGYLLRYLKKNYPELKVLISYADGIRDKIGTIYQATNFIYIGYVKGEFYYIEDDDEWVHPVSMYHRHGSRSKETLNKYYKSWKKIRGKQYRYIYFLDKEWKSHLKIKPKKYPKKTR